MQTVANGVGNAQCSMEYAPAAAHRRRVL
eukprot:COSAG02_NODE_36928_length_448_cov_3.659026_1_plen_28_part_10